MSTALKWNVSVSLILATFIVFLSGGAGSEGMWFAGVIYGVLAFAFSMGFSNASGIVTVSEKLKLSAVAMICASIPFAIAECIF